MTFTYDLKVLTMLVLQNSICDQKNNVFSRYKRNSFIYREMLTEKRLFPFAHVSGHTNYYFSMSLSSEFFSRYSIDQLPSYTASKNSLPTPYKQSKIHSYVEGTGDDPPSSKRNGFFMLLAMSVPIFNKKSHRIQAVEYPKLLVV